MKKLLALLIAAALIFSLAACSASGTDSKGDNASDNSAAEPTEAPVITAADDTDVLAMHFNAPEGYDTVERYIEKFSDGSISQKTLTYEFADDSEIMVGYTYGHSITEAVSQEKLDEAEIAEYAGKSFYIIEQYTTVMAVNQEENYMYGIGYTFSGEIDREKFDAFMDGVSFTDSTATEENDDDMYEIHYALDSTWKISTTNSNQMETPDGEIVKKSIGWHVGEDEDNLDFRFVVRVFKNAKVEDQLSEDKEYEEQEINGVTYTVLKTSDDHKPYEYYTQRGDDVYMIRNNGVSGGWGVDRTEESEAAFETLLNSISFD